MLAVRCAQVLYVVVLTTAFSVVAAFAQDPAAGLDSRIAASRPTSVPKSAGFTEAAERLRLAAASGAWRKAGWNDSVIESYLGGLVDDAERLTETTGLPRAPGFAGLARHARVGAMIEVELVLPDGGDVAHARHSVILAAGNVKVAHAHGCVVFALGDVAISHGSGNIVVAGGRITLGFDGRKPERGSPSEPLRSLIVAGGAVEIAHARRSVVRAGAGLTTSHETEVIELGFKGGGAVGGPESRPPKPSAPGVVPSVPRRVFAADLSGAPKG